MDLKRFNDVVDTQLFRCLETLAAKGLEYAPTAIRGGDRLENFKIAAEGLGTKPKQALWGMAYKQLASIGGLCSIGEPVNPETEKLWQEKITDSINYLLLLWALVREEAEPDV